MKKRILSLFVILCLTVSLLPGAALASSEEVRPEEALPETGPAPAAEEEILPLIPVGTVPAEESPAEPEEAMPEPEEPVEEAVQEPAEEPVEEPVEEPLEEPTEDGAPSYYYDSGLNLSSVTADRTYTASAGGSAKAVWDYDTLTLTLSGGTSSKPMAIGGTVTLPDGATLAVSGVVTVGGYGIRSEGAVTLSLASGCDLTVTSSQNGGIETAGLTVDGSGSMSVQGTWSGIETDGTLEIRGGTVTTRCTNGYGISATKFLLSGGTVNAYGGTNTSSGNRDGVSVSRLEISGGTLNAYGADGIACSTEMTVSGGTVYAEGDTWYGIDIYYKAAMTIRGGKVTAVGDDVEGLHLFAYNGEVATLNVQPPSGKQVVLSAGDSSSSYVSFPHESEYSTNEMDYVWFRSEGQTLKNNNKGYYNSGLDLRSVTYGGYYTDKNGSGCRVTFDPVAKTVTFTGGTASAPLSMNSSSVGLYLPAGQTLVVEGSFP